jgi:hypothetical protein
MKLSLIIVAVMFMFVGCAQSNPESAILEAVQRDSATYCSGRANEGCEFSIVKTPDGWGVMAKPIVRAENGERVYVPGLWQSYSYDEHGNLLREMPGI